MTKKYHAVVLLSGGMDSATLLAYVLNRTDYKVTALSANYGQRHCRELEHAKAIADFYGNLHFPNMKAHHQADLRSLSSLATESSQTNLKIDVPQGHYTDESMKATIVPNRNMVLISLAVALGHSMALQKQNKASAYVYCAAHAGDHAIYPDCRPGFFTSMAISVAHATGGRVKLEAPFINITKADIAAIGQSLNVPFNLTYSCYEGRERHCGKCGTCVERKEAFALANMEDPTEYEPE